MTRRHWWLAAVGALLLLSCAQRREAESQGPAPEAPETPSVLPKPLPVPPPPPPAVETPTQRPTPPPPPRVEAPAQQPAPPPPPRVEGPAQQPSQPPQVAVIPGFPWPPPAASATEVLPSALLLANRRLETLGDVDALLSASLGQNGYVEKSYFGVPEGFALATRLERIQANGRSMTAPARWAVASSGIGTNFSLGAYLRALFTADPGYYRVIVFIVTEVPFAQAQNSVKAADAEKWLRSGLNVLPEPIARRPYGSGVVATALVYEFRRDNSGSSDVLLPSPLTARAHLVESGLWKALGGQ